MGHTFLGLKMELYKLVTWELKKHEVEAEMRF
jgi:hypothetical protein